ncbi:hypothetical protein PUN28_004109 [Cardiocondyla obscurior]|uniref:Uncharacterized protein n=1 Tax=Cardiocondyla obscurior TaxID=286306 RepID=A0AAW2GPN8_9HYME
MTHAWETDVKGHNSLPSFFKHLLLHTKYDMRENDYSIKGALSVIIEKYNLYHSYILERKKKGKEDNKKKKWRIKVV